MRLEQLRYLIEIDKYSSISLTSRKIHVTQQNISTAISQLEKELAITILQRTSKGVAFTEDGRIVLEKAQEVLAKIVEIENYALIKNQLTLVEQSKLDGKMNLWISPYFAKNFFLKVLGEFMQCYPNVEIEVRTTASLEILDMFGSPQAMDMLALINLTHAYYRDYLTDHPLLYTKVINTDYLTVLLNKKSQLAQNKSISIKKVLNQKIIFYKGDNGKNDWLLDYLLSFNQPLNTFTTNSPEICLSSLKKNNAITVMANQAAKVFTTSEEVLLIPIRPKVEICNLLVMNHDHQLTVAEQKLIQMVQEISEDGQ